MTSRTKLMLATATAVVMFGIAAYSAVFTIAVGRLSHSEVFNGPATVTVQQRTIAPGESLPWHYHPGLAYLVMKRGTTLALEDGCGGQEIRIAGEAFEEIHGRVHRATNLGPDEVENIITYVVPEGLPPTVPTPDNVRLCGPPINANECNSGGWSKFSFPRSFHNQGDCEHYVMTGK